MVSILYNVRNRLVSLQLLFLMCLSFVVKAVLADLILSTIHTVTLCFSVVIKDALKFHLV